MKRKAEHIVEERILLWKWFVSWEGGGNVVSDPYSELRKTWGLVSTILLKGTQEIAGKYNHHCHRKHHSTVGRTFWSQTDQGLNPGFATNLLYNLFISETTTGPLWRWSEIYMQSWGLVAGSSLCLHISGCFASVALWGVCAIGSHIMRQYRAWGNQL